MPKKTHSKNSVERLATALEKKKEHKVITNPRGGNPPEAYRFRPGVSGNPSGISGQRQRVAELIEKMRNSSPPRDLCEELGIDPKVKWDEAILIVLGRTAMSGDVSAAREVLAAFGMSSTVAKTNVLVNVEGERGISYEFLRHAHGLNPEQLATVWAFMDALPRQKPEIDASYFPDDSYRRQPAAPKQLTAGTTEEEEGESK